MEAKGRRTPRAPGRIGAPAEPPKPIEIRATTEDSVEAPAEPSKPTEPALNLLTRVAVSASPPSVIAVAKMTTNTPSDDPAYFGRETFAALTQAQAALARGLEAMSAEMAGLALSGIDAATRAATKMLGIKTLSDAIEVNAGFTCSSLDTLVTGSARLSELGVKLATETSQPIVTQFGKGWIKASRLGS